MRNLDRKSLAVLVIAYKRIYNTKTILDFSYSQGIRKFYICIDGPKDSNFDTQNQFQDMISSFSLNYGIDIKTKFSKYNLGCAQSVINGIDWAFNFEEDLIILEDDCLPGGDFFSFMKASLSYISANSQVKLASGSQLLELNQIDPWYLSKYPILWGWATNKKNWSEIMVEVFNGKNLMKGWHLKRFYSSDYAFWFSGAYRALNKSIDTWDLPIAFWAQKNNYYTIHPAKNYIRNVGNDEYAVHTDFGSQIVNLANNFSFEYKQEIPKFRSDIDSLYKDFIFHIRKRHIISTFFTRLLDLIHIN